MTVCGLGLSWRACLLWAMKTPAPAEAVGVLPGVVDVATCQAVDRRDTKIEPVPPGMPISPTKQGSW